MYNILFLKISVPLSFRPSVKFDKPDHEPINSVVMDFAREEKKEKRKPFPIPFLSDTPNPSHAIRPSLPSFTQKTRLAYKDKKKKEKNRPICYAID